MPADHAAPAVRPGPVTVLAATRIEAWAAGRAAGRSLVRRTGLGLRGWEAPHPAGLLVTCGLAGALTPGMPPGTVLVPTSAGLPDRGEPLPCDPVLVRALVRGARALGYRAVTGPLLTSPGIVTGERRRAWRDRGYVAADMETALLLFAGHRAASVRVVLDGPEHEIEGGWDRPLHTLARPRAWVEAARLARDAPRWSVRAARVLAAGLRYLEGDLDAEVEA